MRSIRTFFIVYVMCQYNFLSQMFALGAVVVSTDNAHPACRKSFVAIQHYDPSEEHPPIMKTNNIVLCCQAVCSSKGMTPQGSSLVEYGSFMKEQCHCAPH